MSAKTVAKKDIKAFSEDAGRRKREESAVQLRKVKKEESLSKKRNVALLSSTEEAAAFSGFSEAAAIPGVPEELDIKHLSAYVAGQLHRSAWREGEGCPWLSTVVPTLIFNYSSLPLFASSFLLQPLLLLTLPPRVPA